MKGTFDQFVDRIEAHLVIAGLEYGTARAITKGRATRLMMRTAWMLGASPEWVYSQFTDGRRLKALPY